jgi:hypothetical protein
VDAPALPLIRSQVRVKKDEVYELVAAMRDSFGDERAATAAGELLAAADAVERAVYTAQPVPLMDEVRLPRERVEELVRGLRAAGA